ncbi:hypothetical protein ENBRE01_1935, partial [Enteropsectra breve]
MARSIKITTLIEKENIIEYCATNVAPSDLRGNALHNFLRLAKNFEYQEGTLFLVKNGARFIFFCEYETAAKNLFIEAAHGRSHIGHTQTEEYIFARACGISRAEIRAYVKNCRSCQLVTVPSIPMPVCPIIENKAMDRMIADSIDMREYDADNDGFKWILNIVDSYTKFAWSFAMHTKSSEEYAAAFESLILNEGCPKILHCDNGKEFKNRKIDALCDGLNICRIYGRVRHPQSQGQVERFNGTLKQRLRKSLAGSTRWVDIHKKIIFEYNTHRHRATSKTPFELLRGRSGLRETKYVPRGEEV